MYDQARYSVPLQYAIEEDSIQYVITRFQFESVREIVSISTRPPGRHISEASRT